MFSLSVIPGLTRNPFFKPFIFLLAQENEPKEGHPAQISGRYARSVYDS
jgi:hypothetical protein